MWHRGTPLHISLQILLGIYFGAANPENGYRFSAAAVADFSDS
jgi:hypothetical protein